MIDRLIFFSIKNKLLVVLMVLGWVGAGVYSAFHLPIDAVPDITNNQVQVITVSPTLAALEIERLITAPVEYAVSTLQGLVELRSVSRFGLSVITIVFDANVEPYKARQMVGERLKMVADKIPAGYAQPELMPPTTGLGEIYQYTLRHKADSKVHYNAMQLREIQDWIVKKRLLGVEGVAEVSSIGGFVKEYEVAIDPERLRSHNLSVSQVADALNKANENTGGAYIQNGSTLEFIRGLGAISSPKELSQVALKTYASGIPITVGDVAEVKQGFAPRYGAMTDENGECVGGIVLMLKGAGSSKTIEAVKKRIQEINLSLPEGLYIEAFLDRTKLIDKTLSTIISNLVEGALIVIFVLVLMLGNLRAGLLLASVVPLAMLFAIWMMYSFGLSGNLMSLGAIDFGIIVDGAVIIVEAILLKLHHSQPQNQTQHEELVFESARKIRSTAAFGEMIILIVYVPILTLQGIEGKMFTPMALTVGFAIIGAFFLSLTYVPMMSALWLKASPHEGFSHHLTEKLQKLYVPVLKRALRNQILVLGFSLGMLALALGLFAGLGGEFIPKLDEGDFALEVRLPTGASLDNTIKTTLKASRLLLDSFPEVRRTVGKIGSSEIPTDPMPIEACDLMVLLTDKSEWRFNKEQLAQEMKQSLERHIPGLEFGFMQPIEMRFNELLSGAKQDVALVIYGEEMEQLSQISKIAENIASEIEGVEDVYRERIGGLPEISVRYKRERLAQYDLKVSELNRTLRMAFAGEKAGMIFEGMRGFDVVVRFDTSFRKSIQNVRKLYVSLPNSNQVPLEEVADIEMVSSPSQISRQNSQRKVTVAFNTRGRDVESVVEELKTQLNVRLKLPPGYYYQLGGQYQNLKEAKERLMVALPLALLLILTLLYFTFHSIKLAALVFIAIPFAAVGGILALVFREMNFSISAGVGFIALFGVAVLNGIVMVGYFKELEQRGFSVAAQVLRGATARLRPVIMTALVASLGFLPMALSGSAGAEVQRPLATVVIGGLISSTALTLLVLPVLYTLIAPKHKS
jgi:cobalt-zinc-cadmium resistance protein CzcA